MKSKYFLWGNGILVPSDAFVDEFLKLTGVYLAASGMHFTMLTSLFRKFSFNILKFEEELVSKHGYNIDVHGSIRSFVTKTFGERAMEMTEQLIKGSFESMEA